MIINRKDIIQIYKGFVYCPDEKAIHGITIESQFKKYETASYDSGKRYTLELIEINIFGFGTINFFAPNETTREDIINNMILNLFNKNNSETGEILNDEG